MDVQKAKLHLETSMLMGVDFLPVAAPSETEPLTDSATLLQKLSAEHDATCPHCTNAAGFTQTVFGDGNPNARLMFVGEAPSAEDDQSGVAFVGNAGNKLDEIITAMGLQREDVYITNVLKSKPPNDRTPSPKEIERCAIFLVKQVAIIKPEIIVALGAPAAKFLLGTASDITALRGTWGEYESIPVMPTFHPAFLLRNYTKETRSQMWADMQQVMTILGI